METGYFALISSTVAFVGGHFLLSSIPVRKKIISKTGENNFLGLYSLYALITLIFMVQSWRHSPFMYLWDLGTGARHFNMLLMFFASIFTVLGLTAKNPTAVGQESVLSNDEPAKGIVRITRHPSLWGFALWGLAHIIVNGDLGAFIFFSGFFILSFFGMFHIDYRRKSLKKDEWAKFEEKTSLIPFYAILKGKNTFNFKEIGLPKVLSGIILFIILIMSHKYLIGVPIINF